VPNLLLLTRAVIAADPTLHADLPAWTTDAGYGIDPVFDSLCQFDFLVSLVTATAYNVRSREELGRRSYPTFARAFAQRTSPITSQVIFDPIVRGALLPEVTDPELALIMNLIDQLATSEAFAFNGWHGYTEQDVHDFIRRQLGQ